MHQGRSQPLDTARTPPAQAVAGGLAPATVALGRGDGATLVLGDGRTRLMAVLNLTPDSFSDGGLHSERAAALRRAEELVAGGADILDLGAESTRPGAAPVAPEDEWRRLAPVLPALARAGLPVVLSVDTRHLATAARAADAGARLLNLPFPGGLLRQGGREAAQAVLRRFDGVVLMHARGTPATMGGLCDYEDPVPEAVAAELLAVAAALCDEELGGRVIFDPGLGFAKQAPQSLALLGQVAWLRARLRRPVLVGASRKSMLGWATGLPVEQRLIPSVVAAALAAWQGADVVRVHDAAETHAALRLVEAVRAAVGGGP